MVNRVVLMRPSNGTFETSTPSLLWYPMHSIQYRASSGCCLSTARMTIEDDHARLAMPPAPRQNCRSADASVELLQYKNRQSKVRLSTLGSLLGAGRKTEHAQAHKLRIGLRFPSGVRRVASGGPASARKCFKRGPLRSGSPGENRSQPARLQ